MFSFFRRSMKNATKLAKAARKRGSRGLRLEPLERRELMATVPVTLNIHDFQQLAFPDDDGDGDYYAEVTIGNNPEQSTRNRTGNPIERAHFNPQWFFTEFIDPAAGLVPVKIQIFDYDTLTSDEHIDINPTPGVKDIDLLFDPVGGTLQGRARGDASDDVAEITFDMFLSAEVTFTVTRLDELDDPDDNDSTEGDGGDYAFGVTIGDYREFYSTDFVFDPGPQQIPFTVFVNPADVVVSIDVRVVDVDFLSGNETMDINPRSGETKLSLFYNPTTGQWDEQNLDFTFPVNVTEGNSGDRARLFFDISTPTADSDGDGLLDTWETNGIDVNSDGVIDFHPNSNPRHKDLFVEVDAMVGLSPMNGVLQDVINAFAAVPNSLVNNPDGQNGITLHAILDETNIPMASWAGQEFGPFDAIKMNTNPNIPGGFGTVADRASPNAANILAAKRPFFRYSMFADQYGSGSSSGQAEIGGNDFYVTLGSLWMNVSPAMQASTFMHELGHTLGLYHGGHQAAEPTFNNKPNYHSVMNYIWQMPGPVFTTSTPEDLAFNGSWKLDYSRSAFNTLDENHLNESAGIGGHAGHLVRLENGKFVPESGPVNWDGDGTANETDVSVEINNTSHKNTLEGSEDWSHLQFTFRNNANYADGVHPDVEGNEITFQNYVEQNDVLLYGAPAGNGADNLTLRRKGDKLEVYDNNTRTVVASRALADTRVVQIVGAAGENDTLTVDFKSGGYFTVPSGIGFDGGDAGLDRLKIVGNCTTTGEYLPSGVTAGDGTVRVALGNQSVGVAFAGLEPVEISAMASLALITPNSDDYVTLTSGRAIGGQKAYVAAGTSSGVAMESLTFFDVDRFTLDAAANDGALAGDTITVDLGTAGADVHKVNVLTGAGDDAITVSASPCTIIFVDAGADAGDMLNFAGKSLSFSLASSSVTTSSRKPVTHSGVETLALFSGVYQVPGTVAPNVIVDSGATLKGGGIIQGSVTVNPGGIIDPATSGPGILRTGDLTLVAGGTYQVQLKGLTAGTKHDQLRVSGSVDLGGATLAGTLGFNALPGDELVIIRNDGSDPVVGKFASGDIVTIGGDKFAIDYAFDGDGDGQFNDVALVRYGAELGPDPCDCGQTALFVSGTTGDDVIRFVPATGNSRVRVLINGVDEGTFKSSGLLVGYGQAGHDTISVELPSRSAWLYGQGGDDTLLTGNGNSILLGGVGNDQLTAGNGKDILIGGAGADVLIGGNGDDLLIAGSTAYESNSDADHDALCDIFDEWQSGSGGYDRRIKHLRLGGGKNGRTVLNSTTVFDDSAVDQLLGDNGQDWFLLNLTGGVLDNASRTSNETATDI